MTEAKFPSKSSAVEPAKPSVKLTRIAKLVYDSLKKKKQILTPYEIFDDIKSQNHNIGLSSIYRGIDLLTKYRLITYVNLGDNQKRYEVLNSKDKHHHHLVCTKCKSCLHLKTCIVKLIHKLIQKKYGFKLQSHIFELFGICPKCKAIT